MTDQYQQSHQKEFFMIHLLMKIGFCFKVMGIIALISFGAILTYLGNRLARIGKLMVDYGVTR